MTKHRKFLFSVISFFVSSTVVITIPFMNYFNGNMKIILGIVFWVFLILGLLLFLALPQPRKKRIDVKAKPRGRPSALFFFRNKIATVADVVLVASIILNIVFLNIYTIQIIQVIAMFFLTFSAEMHFVFNSNRYKYIKLKSNIILEEIK